MLGDFNIPSVDHLREGIDYVVMDWDFASPPVPHTPGESCPPGYKMIFGMCRKLRAGSQDWDTEGESDMEKAGKAAATKAGSTFDTNKPVDIGGKKYGWAKKNGKPVMVEWGSVCAKKVDGKCVPAPGLSPVTAPTPAAPTAGGTTPAAAPAAAPQKTREPKEMKPETPPSPVTWA